MSYNKKAHLLTNIEAIRIAFALDREKRKATGAERSFLQRYSGFGGLRCILCPTQTKEKIELNSLLNLKFKLFFSTKNITELSVETKNFYYKLVSVLIL